MRFYGCPVESEMYSIKTFLNPAVLSILRADWGGFPDMSQLWGAGSARLHPTSAMGTHSWALPVIVRAATYGSVIYI